MTTFSTGWHITLVQTSRWHQNKGCVLVHGTHTKTELLYWCQRAVWTNVMCHPAHYEKLWCCQKWLTCIVRLSVAYLSFVLHITPFRGSQKHIVMSTHLFIEGVGVIVSTLRLCNQTGHGFVSRYRGCISRSCQSRWLVRSDQTQRDQCALKGRLLDERWSYFECDRSD